MRKGKYFIVVSWKETASGKDGPDSYRQRQSTVWQKAGEGLATMITKVRVLKSLGCYESVTLYQEVISAKRIPVL